jgi:hypothetical protein
VGRTQHCTAAARANVEYVAGHCMKSENGISVTLISYAA